MSSSRCSPADITALILAGGKATRLGGVDKRELVVEGRTIFARQCEALLPRVSEILVSSPRAVAGFRTVSDAIPDAGPLAGIAAGLAAATTPWLLVLAGDMPHISGPLLDLVLGKRTPERLAALEANASERRGEGWEAEGGRGRGEEVEAVGIRIGGMPEPLLCVLRVSAARPVVEARLAAKRLKASRLLTDGELRVVWIEEGEVRAIDPTLRVLFNVNAPGDLV